MLQKPARVAIAAALICSITACSTSTRLSSERVAGDELSRKVIGKTVTDKRYHLKEIDRYSAGTEVTTCTVNTVQAEYAAIERTEYQVKGPTSGQVVKTTFIYYPMVTLASMGIYPLFDILSGFKLTREVMEKEWGTRKEVRREKGEGTITREFPDQGSKTCSTGPATTEKVKVAFNGESIELTPSSDGVVKLPADLVGSLERREKMTHLAWDLEGSKLRTTSDYTPPKPKPVTVNSVFGELSKENKLNLQLTDRSGFFHNENKLLDKLRNELPKYYRLEKVANLPPGREGNRVAQDDHSANRLDRENAAAQRENAPNALAAEENHSANRLDRENVAAQRENAANALAAEENRSANKLDRENAAAQRENAANALAAEENHSANRLDRENVAAQRDNAANTLAAEENHSANRLDREDATAQRGSDANEVSAQESAMNRLAEQKEASLAAEQSGYRLVPIQKTIFFKSGDFTGNVELPVIDPSGDKPVELKSNILSRKVKSLLPAYENEDRNLRVSLNDGKMSITNKSDRTLQLKQMSLYYNGKFVDNILDHQMELAPGETVKDISLTGVMDRELGLMAKYNNLTAEQAQRMKINFGLGASYLDPESGKPALMNRVNSYDVFEMVNNMPETARLEEHMLSIIDEKAMPSSEVREMLASALQPSEAVDPTELQFDMKVEFDTGKANIRPEFMDNLNKIGIAMQKFPKLHGVIEGHTDSVGSEQTNQRLSERRALSVKQYLVEKFGVEPARIQTEGFGSSRPVADNKTALGRAQNRRIQGRITEAGV
ncbi:OmpA family protein [Geomonas sp. Red32]|uniref:OmpA family protein n=1 Tax=Geomonas sp. Red32 TaxID=2912856 RepID=UPI00202CBF43|nr:OmpA family protein [Geomonas sp. Red32]MCM0080519.1 OmpA family protein [Geomonas sp. Red32]